MVANPNPPVVGDFTRREIEVLELVAAGLSNGEIARTLFVTVGVVERHVTRAFRVLVPEAAENATGRRAENRRVRAVLAWLHLTGRLP